MTAWEGIQNYRKIAASPSGRSQDFSAKLNTEEVILNVIHAPLSTHIENLISAKARVPPARTSGIK